MSRTCAYQGVRNVRVFWKIWRALFSWNTCFKICPFTLLLTKLTILLSLTSAARASEIGSLDIRYLIKHSSGYTFHFGKNAKKSKGSKPEDPIKFHIFKENQSQCVCQCNNLYLKRAKEIRGQNPQHLLSFVKRHGPVSTPTISRWIMIWHWHWNVYKTARAPSSSKAKKACVPTGVISKCGFSSKKSTFQKFYRKGSNAEDRHFQLCNLKSFEKRV